MKGITLIITDAQNFVLISWFFLHYGRSFTPAGKPCWKPGNSVEEGGNACNKIIAGTPAGSS